MGHPPTSAGNLVAAELQRQERSVRWLSNKTGIPYSTLQRKVSGSADIYSNELVRIASVLDVSIASLVPEAVAS